jgi:hypothetical protein
MAEHGSVSDGLRDDLGRDPLDRGMGSTLGREPQESAAENQDPAGPLREVRAPEGDGDALPEVRGPVERAATVPICIRCKKGDHFRCLMTFTIWSKALKFRRVACPCPCREFARSG